MPTKRKGGFNNIFFSSDATCYTITHRIRSVLPPLTTLTLTSNSLCINKPQLYKKNNFTLVHKFEIVVINVCVTLREKEMCKSWQR